MSKDNVARDSGRRWTATAAALITDGRLRPLRIAALGLLLYVGTSLAQVWGGRGSFSYEQASWDGHRWHYTGRVITVCDWRCYVGL